MAGMVIPVKQRLIQNRFVVAKREGGMMDCVQALGRYKLPCLE